MDFLTHGTEGTEYELRGLYRLKSCGGGPFEDLAMIDHLVLGHWTNSSVGRPWGGRTGKWVIYLKLLANRCLFKVRSLGLRAHIHMHDATAAHARHLQQ